MSKLHVHLKAGHGRTELKNGSIAIVAEPSKTIDVDAKQHRLAMSSGIFANGPFKAKKTSTAANPATGPEKTTEDPVTGNSRRAFGSF